MVDDETIRTYNTKVDDYAQSFARNKPSDALKNFMSLLPAGGRVLDWGCGPAASSYHLREAGFVPDPMDASSEMVALANEKYDLKTRIGTFDDELEEASYDGVWANFSLLHARRADLPKHIQQIHIALLPRGIFYMGMKTGTGENRDKLGRFYTFYQIDELTRFIENAGFKIAQIKEGEGTGLAGNIEPYVLITSQKL